MTQEDNLEQFSVSKIFVPENIREPGWEKNLDQLVASIKQNGQIEPIVIKPYPEDKRGPAGETHELVVGQRRLAAIKKMGRTHVKVSLASTKLTVKERFLMQLAENDDRENLSPMEQARSYRRAIDEHKMTVHQIAQARHLTDGFVSQRLSLLTLPAKVQEAVEKGRITPTHAREIARVTDEKEQLKLLKNAETMPITEFKEKVADLDSDKKKSSNRGRPKKTEKATDNEKPAKAGKISIAVLRSKKEISQALAETDKRLHVARDADKKSEINKLVGMQLALMWVANFPNAKSLWPE